MSSRYAVAWGVALASIFAVGLWLRVDGIGVRVLSHPENFAPGLDVPNWVRFPPPRHDVVGVLRGASIDGPPPTHFFARVAVGARARGARRLGTCRLGPS